MGNNTVYVGLDVHSETIAVAVAEPGRGTVRSLGVIPNRPEAIRKLLAKLGPKEALRVCYEAGPCGYVLYWYLTKLGVHCEVIAPTLVPVKAGDRVKTDRRDAEKLARCYRNGDLTPVWVPDEAHEALRDLVRAREAAKKDQLVARHRLQKFLLRAGCRRPEGVKSWSLAYFKWVNCLTFEHQARKETFLDYLNEVERAADRIKRLEAAIDRAIEDASAEMKVVVRALQALRGVAKVTAVTLVAELGQISRFSHPSQLMGYSGMVPREHSSGGDTKRGSITKTGNAHVRRVIGEAAWAYRHKPVVKDALKKRQEGLPEDIKAIAWKAQKRLYTKYHRMTSQGKAHQKAITAIGRELLGFVWAIAVRAEQPAA